MLINSLLPCVWPAYQTDHRSQGTRQLPSTRGILFGTYSTSGMVEPAWVIEVLDFWFDKLGEAHWFLKSEEIDAQIRDRCCAAINLAVRSRNDDLIGS